MDESSAATPEASGARKPCVSCRELIPSDATICSHCRSSQVPPKKSPYKDVLKWVGGIAAIIGLVLSGIQLFGPAFTRLHNHREVDRLLNEAKTESDNGDYHTALTTYDHALQLLPDYAAAKQGRCDAAMAWLRNFSAAGADDKEVESRASAQLSELFPILEADLAGQKGPREADILAHIGWAHWLNFHIALKDVPSSAEKSFRRALAVDSRNVYANAMLGNWLLQNGQRLEEAKQHFSLAVESGRDRLFVRALQLGGMIYVDDIQTQIELTRVANQMRKNGEKISESNRSRIISTNYSPDMIDDVELVRILAALPSDEAWATYVWLDETTDSSDEEEQSLKQLKHKFIEAKIKEISGKDVEALALYRSLQAGLRETGSTLGPRVALAIKNLTHKQ
jgi:tetratricopeptide (TPR) repeat protein